MTQTQSQSSHPQVQELWGTLPLKPWGLSLSHCKTEISIKASLTDIFEPLMHFFKSKFWTLCLRDLYTIHGAATLNMGLPGETQKKKRKEKKQEWQKQQILTLPEKFTRNKIISKNIFCNSLLALASTSSSLCTTTRLLMVGNLS